MTDASIAAAYDDRATEYVTILGDVDQMDAADRATIARWRDDTSGRLLDAGCGPGHWTAFLQDGNRDVVGLDLSMRFIEAARSRHPHLRFVHGSFRDLAFEDASLGGILAWYSLIHTDPDEVPGILAEFARVIASGGTLLLGYFDGEPREHFSHAVAPAFFWSADTIGDLVSTAGFSVLSSERRERLSGEVSRRPHGALIAQRR